MFLSLHDELFVYDWHENFMSKEAPTFVLNFIVNPSELGVVDRVDPPVALTHSMLFQGHDPNVDPQVLAFVKTKVY